MSDSRIVTLPTSPVKGVIEEPRKLMIFSHPKVGKTSNLIQLPNCLIIDLENNADLYDGMSVNVVKIAKENKISMLDVLKITLKELKSSKKKYDFIVIDTTSALEEIATDLALQMYKKSSIGKGFTGTDIINELPRGAGYGWLRKAFMKIYTGFETIPSKCLILSGHVKSSSITKDGKEMGARDINLTGKLKLIVSADVYATGFMYRKSDTSENWLTFKTMQDDLITGSRQEYLANKEFLISKKENGKVITNWSQIFPSIKK